LLPNQVDIDTAIDTDDTNKIAEIEIVLAEFNKAKAELDAFLETSTEATERAMTTRTRIKLHPDAVTAYQRAVTLQRAPLPVDPIARQAQQHDSI
jgi:hypothetical protein